MPVPEAPAGIAACAALRAAGDVRDAELKASYASTLRPHTLIPEVKRSERL